MGTTSKPLIIVVLSPCQDWEEIAKLEAQGHKVTRLDIDADIILGARAWRMDHQHRLYLPLAIKEARVLRYPRYEERASSKNRARLAEELDISPTVESISSEEPSE